MKLTKKLEAEILKVYKAYWDTYLNGDMKTLASMLDDDVTVFGTAVSEVFNNKKETLRFYKATADQLVGKVQFRNRKINVNEVDNNVLVNEQCDLYFLMDKKWTFYAHVRVSAILKHTKTGWKLVHQHASFPDMRAEEGEQLAAEKIKAENIQLRDAVKRRTIELEEKNRELEIEASLEKVRAQALGMYKPDDLLNVCKVLFKELSLLGFSEIRNAVIHTFNDEGNYLIDYDYSDLIGGIITTIPYSDQPVIKRFLKQIRKSDEAFAEVTVKGKELNEWKKFRKSGGQPEDPRLDKTSALYYYFHSVGTADIGISTFSSINEEQLQLLKRFRNVFDLAYKRYTDITKAEAQAREAQIEASLERVRSRAMAMQTSEELNELIGTVFTELTKLDLVLTRCVILIYEGNEKGVRWWMANSEAPSTPMNFFVKYANLPFFNEYLKGWHERSLKWEYILEGEDKIRTDNVLFNETELSRLPDFVIAGMKANSKVYLSASFNNYGCLNLASLEPLSDEHFDILLRFAKVFDLTYTRFNDLKQAEAQAREATIEAALEKVRARAMAMQTSEDVVSATSVLFGELERLGIKTMRCGILVIEESQTMEIWTSVFTKNAQVTKLIGKLDMTIHPLLAGIFRSWKQKDEIFSYKLIGDDIHKYYSALANAYDPYSALAQTNMPDHYCHVYYFEDGGLYTFSVDAHNDETKQIIKKFTAVFSLTFRRYQDLKQAEAQAREAQIEAALEKVRSRSLAMHKSDELQEVVNTVFERLNDLHVEMDSTNIAIFKEGTRDYDYWIASRFQKRTASFHMPYIDLSLTKDLIAARESGKDFSALAYSLEEKNEWFDYAFKNTDFRFLTEERKQFILDAPGIMVAIAFSKHTGVQVNRYSSKLLSEGEAEVLKRFSKVFEQAYIRFLDLQKAEAQAKEAKIEVSMERVRAKAMAMHSSKDLAETIGVFYRELKSLSVMPIRCGVALIDKETRMAEVTTMNTTEQGDSIEVIGKIKMAGHAVLEGVFENWLTQKEYHAVLRGNQIKKYYQVLKPQISYPDYSHDDVQFGYYFMFNEGDVYAWTETELSEHDLSIYRRFTSVISLTYKRYKDLKQAEAQAREAQIEASLERVRAKTMAMHNSQDVGETVGTMFDELVKLGIQTLRCGVGILYEGYQMELWTAKPGETGKIELFVGHLDMKIHPMLTAVYDGWKDKRDSFSYELKEDDLIAYFNAINNYSDYNANYDIASLPSRIVNNLFTFNEGVLFAFSVDQLSAESSQIFKRFAGVFGQTYRRYLDLQKAEAQAKEAQIEASLERVRSKTMAMHNSQDVGDTVATMLDELVKLGVETVRCGIAIIDVSKTMEVWTALPKGDGSVKLIIGQLDMAIHPLFRMVYDAWKNKVPVTTYELVGEDLKDYFRAVNNSPDYPIRYDLESLPDKQSNTAFMFPEGSLFVFSQAPLTTETTQIFKRFTGVFGQTYRRYLDLQKAEAQARDAKIEASLERVRAKAMAMHKSEDLNSVVATVFEEHGKLNLGVLRCGVGIFNKEKRTGDVWSSTLSSEGSAIQVSGDESFDIHPLLSGTFDAWLEQKEFSYELEGEDLYKYYNELSKTNFNLPISDSVKPEIKTPKQYYYTPTFQAGNLYAFSETPFSEEAKKIMRRFATVLNLTYNRFLDLQKAEAQAREAKIEAALERVRSRTMAMHKSDELSETAVVLFKQLSELGNDPDRFSIGIIDEDAHVMNVYATDQEGSQVNIRFKARFDEKTTIDKMYKGWKAKLKSDVIHLKGKDLEDWIKYLRDELGMAINIEHFNGQRFHNVAYFSQGWLNFTTVEPPSPETISLLERFAAVFNLTYRRFLDLQKAEANAREAQIEAGLERVRARTMAMHSSDDVSAATATMFTELEKLGIENFRGGIAILLPNRTQEVWSVNNLAEGKIVKAVGTFNIDDHSFWQHMYKEWQDKKEFLHHFLAGKEKGDFVKILSSLQNYLPQSLQQFPDVHFQVYYFGEGAVFTNSLQPHSEEDQQVMKRFTSVFSLTFRRYQDLRKAEAQAREATIEAALEKVRGKAMAMHNSNDLTATASLVFTELRKLGINPVRCGISLQTKESRKNLLYYAIPSAEGDNLSLAGTALLEGHPVLSEVYDSWIRDEDYFPVLKGELLTSYYQILKQVGFDVPASPAEHEQYGYYLSFSEGMFYGWAETPFTESEIKILKRFASVIDLTFRRYMELQKSEANAREAVKQAALDRVRAEIASMRTVSDLERITPLIWNELTILGVPFIRCGVFIMDEEQQLIHTFLSTPDGKAIAAFHLPYDTPGNFGDMLSHWYIKKTYISRWDEIDFIGIAETLVKQGAIANKEQYLGSLPRGGFYLHFLPFLQGMLYVGNTDQLNSEQIELIRHVAGAFSTAYARYEDFNRLEAAKQQVENTLTDLKQAQTQLVQSEKMASLGELTAGIAHEIQNPLNFVNNFSEVSKELLDEMKEELATGNGQQAMEIAQDIIRNLEKINHHGKRADAIVKSMLQHSRSSSGKKEPTDINALADEYLRLAYHGLRAKDKSFNAKFETEFDSSIGKINIISQDIGRVLVNLINNAFYAVSERKKQASNGYEPIVTVATRRVKSPSGDLGALISVKDNGNGIPPKVLDKIFQPFFTTKPTGQGTGLGLSLSYDIITKGHGGELKVDTKEGEGSEFIIQIPMN